MPGVPVEERLTLEEQADGLQAPAGQVLQVGAGAAPEGGSDDECGGITQG